MTTKNQKNATAANAAADKNNDRAQAQLDRKLGRIPEVTAETKTPRPESKAMMMKALLKTLNKATQAANVEYRSTVKAIKSTEGTAMPDNSAQVRRWDELKEIIKAARAEMKALRPLVKGNKAARANFIQARKAAQEKREDKITAAITAFTLAQAAIA